MTVNDIYKAIPELKFTELHAYLRNTGWNRIELPKPTLALFQKNIDDNFFETILPLNKDFGDYVNRIADVLEAIASSEKREVHQVLTDLTLPPADTVRFRVINKDTLGGTISFLEGFNFLESAKKSLFTTACDILQPEKYHKRLGLKGAKQFIEECRLGQTEKGSFIASVICPFVDQSPDDRAKQMTIFNTEDDFKKSLTRKITIRMMNSLEKIKKAIDNGNENQIIDLSGQEIISANFLESIVELNSASDKSEIEIMTSWSIFANESNLAPKSVKFSEDYLPVFENIISKIKPVDEGIDDDFIGKISQVKADPDTHSRREGEIILNYVLGDEEKVSKARIVLEKDAYDKACEAHKNGQTVKITGKLKSVGRSKIIENPTFEIV
jgi:hypothetical protein